MSVFVTGHALAVNDIPLSDCVTRGISLCDTESPRKTLSQGHSAQVSLACV